MRINPFKVRIGVWALVFLFFASISVGPAFCTELGSSGVFRNKLGNLNEISLKLGLNEAYFVSIRQFAEIFTAYFDTGGTGSHWAYLVSINTQDIKSLLVPFYDPNHRPSEIIDDAPYDGDIIFKSVRFFNGTLNNVATTFVFVSELDSNPFSDPRGSTATITVFTLGLSELGSPPFQFEQIRKFRTVTKYISADLALNVELGIPLPSDENNQ